MADGSTKPIEAVAAGDRVLTTIPAAGALGSSEVVSVNVHGSESSSAGIVVVDGMLRATRNHPIWVNGRVVTMEQLRAGDEIIAAGGIRTQVRHVALAPGGMPTYDLVLAAGGAYFADGVAVQQKPVLP
jgi:hypothetical protein